MNKNVITVIDGTAGRCGKAKVIGEVATYKSINLGAAVTNCMSNAGHTFVNKLSKRNNNATVNIQDFKLTRYMRYLIVQNADPSKEVVALGQIYFVIQTRNNKARI